MTRRWRQVLRTPTGAATLGALLLLIGLAVLAPIFLTDRADHVDVAQMLQGPSSQHWLGTDALGRDMFARILVATRSSLLEALAVTAIAATGGMLLGGASAALGRRAGRLVAAFITMAVAFPGVLLSMFLAMIFGLGVRGVVLGLGTALIPWFARLTQTLSASVAERDYIAAARGLGVSWPRLIVRHLLPNVAEPLVINITISVGGALLAFSALSFLGLGAQPPAYDWGRLLNENLGGIYVNPAAALGSATALVLAGASFNLLGDTVSKVLGQRPLHRSSSATPRNEAGTGARIGGEHDVALRVSGLTVRFPDDAGRWTTPVRNLNLEIRAGESVGIVGESGSGKTLTGLAIAGLVPHPGRVDVNELTFCGHRLDALGHRERQALLGQYLGIVFQDPASAFNPLLRVGRQLGELLEVHAGQRRSATSAAVVDRLRAVDIGDPERRARQHPHEFSGGMLQRAMIGMSLMLSPRLIIADEPTTGLDVTVQRRVLQLLQRTHRETGAAIVFISHDIAVISQICERVLVMYGGTVVEDLTAEGLVTGGARHPYTRRLLAAIPDLDSDIRAPLATIPGRPPEPASLPAGCPFAPRCERADDQCVTVRPPLGAVDPGHAVACWLPITVGDTA